MSKQFWYKPATVWLAAFCLTAMAILALLNLSAFWTAGEHSMAGFLAGFLFVVGVAVIQILFLPSPWARRYCGLLLGLCGVLGAGVSLITLRQGTGDTSVETGRLILSLIVLQLYLAFAWGKKTRRYFDAQGGPGIE